MISPRIELGTFCVLDRCGSQLHHETKNVKDVCRKLLMMEASHPSYD